MNTRDAGVILARLSGHFGIATDDVTASDWLALIEKADHGIGVAACEALIVGWSRDRRPRPADWIEAVHQAQRRVQLERSTRKALGPGPAPSPDVVAQALADARERLDQAERPARTDASEWAAQHLPPPVNEPDAGGER